MVATSVMVLPWGSLTLRDIPTGMLDESVLLAGEGVALQPIPINVNIIAKTKLTTKIGLAQTFCFTLVTSFARIIAIRSTFALSIQYNMETAILLLSFLPIGQPPGSVALVL